MSRFVVIGGGHAAGQAVASLRQDGFEGEIVVIGDEPHVPYQRPPLSKQYLSGEHTIDRVYLRAAAFYQERKVTLRLGVRATRIDPKTHTVTMSTGETVQYDKLLIATGSRARRLNIPGSDLTGIHYLRTVNDVDAIRAGFGAGKNITIAGGGYIGLEVASVAVTAGLAVTVLEMEERILKRVTTPAMSAFYHGLHAGRGVTVRTSTKVSGFAGKDGHVEAVLTESGERIPADLVIVGVGIIPNTELASEGGIACDNGILVDDHCRTSDPDIYAAGDCTNHPNALLGRRLRLESVPNAMEQARVAARNMAGRDEVYAAFPWFWSDQYEHKLQMVGFSTDGDQQVLRGEMKSRKFAIFYLKDGVVVAVDAVNSPKEFMAGRQMVDKRKAVDTVRLGDPSVDLKTLLS
jgi:3-phenylpropionate/trans-cinnamate dioxygenase ferredoxin reductase component